MNSATPNKNPWVLRSFNNWWWAFTQFNFDIYFCFSIGTHEFSFPNISTFIAFTAALLLSNFKYIFEMRYEFPSMCITVPNCPLTSVSYKSIFTVNITLAFILFLRIPASPTVSLWFRFKTSLSFCIETFFGKLSISFI